MKLGILTDIHEHVEYLQRALASFARQQVEQVVVIGDIFGMGDRIEETCRLLEDAGAIGVWGNHDFGLCCCPEEEIRSEFPERVIQYTTSLRPRLDVAGCHFTHNEPWLNPEDLADLWFFGGLLDEQYMLDRIFNAVPNRLMFTGHLHRWLLATPAGLVDWTGKTVVRLDEGRYYVVIGALCDGQYAIFDTNTSELVPFQE